METEVVGMRPSPRKSSGGHCREPVCRPTPQLLPEPSWSATNCRKTTRAPRSLFATTAFVTRTERVLDAFAARQAADARRQAQGLPPRTRRRMGLGDLVGAGGVNAPPG